MISINDFGMSRLSNAYHAAFHHVVNTQVDEIGDENLGLPAGFNVKYKNAVKAEQVIVNRTMGSANTDLIRAQDALRDTYFRAVRNALRNAKYSSSAQVKALYDTIYKKLLKPYPASIVSEGDHTESSHIRGFIYDVKQFLTESQRTLLGISTDLAALETANEAFESMYLTRVDEYTQNPTGYTAECRAKVDGYWAQLVRTINYYANEMSNPDEDIQAVAMNVASYAENLNQHIAEFLKSVEASAAAAARKSGAGSATEGGANANPGAATDPAGEDEDAEGNENPGGSGADGASDLNKKPVVNGATVTE